MTSPAPETSDLSSLPEISTSEELAKYLKVPLHTLDVWASRGGGPPFHKVSKYRRYHRAEVREWWEQRLVVVVAAGTTAAAEDQPAA